MSHLTRLLKEQAGQGASIAVTLVDRFVLTGIPFCNWDSVNFERWSAMLSIVGLLTLFELGFNLYINNRLTNSLERGNRDEAERIYATGNLIFASCTLAGMACICAILLVPSWAVALGILGGAADIAPIALLALGAMLRIAACGAYSLYRANRQYARLAFILVGSARSVR